MLKHGCKVSSCRHVVMVAQRHPGILHARNVRGVLALKPVARASTVAFFFRFCFTILQMPTVSTEEVMRTSSSTAAGNTWMTAATPTPSGALEVSASAFGREIHVLEQAFNVFRFEVQAPFREL